MKYEQGDQWLKNRLQMPTHLSSRGLAGIAPAIRAQAFFSAKVAQGHVLDSLRKVSDAFTRGELDLATARLRLKDALGSRYEPGSTDDMDLTKLASTARLDLILRQNARMAMAVGEYEQGRDPDMERMFPCWRYIASTSASPRPDHQAFAGKVFRKDDPIWHRIFPPWDFNCKCSVEEVAADEIEPGMVEPPTLQEDDLPDIADSGFQFDPADALRAFDPSLIQDEELRKSTVSEMLEKEILPDGGIIGKRTKPQRMQFMEKMMPGSVLSPEDAAVVPDRARKQQLAKEIDDVLGQLVHIAGEKSTDKAAQLPNKIFDIGHILPSHCKALGIPDGRIILESPGNVDMGFKHWIKHHGGTLYGTEIIRLLELTIWNPLVKPRMEKRGGKCRLIYEWKDSHGNAMCSIFDLNNRRWSVIDAWVPSDQYLDAVSENGKGQ